MSCGCFKKNSPKIPKFSTKMGLSKDNLDEFLLQNWDIFEQFQYL